MVGLPDLVGPAGFAPVEQVEGLPIGLRPLVRQGAQARIEVGNDIMYGAIAGGRPAVLSGNRLDLAVDGGGGGRGIA